MSKEVPFPARGETVNIGRYEIRVPMEDRTLDSGFVEEPKLLGLLCLLVESQTGGPIIYLDYGEFTSEIQGYNAVLAENDPAVNFHDLLGLRGHHPQLDYSNLSLNMQPYPMPPIVEEDFPSLKSAYLTEVYQFLRDLFPNYGVLKSVRRHQRSGGMDVSGDVDGFWDEIREPLLSEYERGLLIEMARENISLHGVREIVSTDRYRGMFLISEQEEEPIKGWPRIQGRMLPLWRKDCPVFVRGGRLRWSIEGVRLVEWEGALAKQVEFEISDFELAVLDTIEPKTKLGGIDDRWCSGCGYIIDTEGDHLLGCPKDCTCRCHQHTQVMLVKEPELAEWLKERFAWSLLRQSFLEYQTKAREHFDRTGEPYPKRFAFEP